MDAIHNETDIGTDITTTPPDHESIRQGRDVPADGLALGLGLGLGLLLVAVVAVALLVTRVYRKKSTSASEVQTQAGNTSAQNEVRNSHSFWKRENKRFVWSFRKKIVRRNNDSCGLIIYDVPPRCPVSVGDIVSGNSTYDHPPRNPVPVGSTAPGYSIYDYPRANPVPVGSTTPGYPIHDRPRNVPIAAEEPMYVNMQGYVNTAVDEPVYANL